MIRMIRVVHRDANLLAADRVYLDAAPSRRTPSGREPRRSSPVVDISAVGAESERVDPGPMRSCPGASSVFVERPFLFSYRMPSSSTVCLLLNNQQSPPGVDRIANAPPAGRRLGPIISIASCSPAEGGKITSRRHEQSEIPGVPVTEPAYMLTLKLGNVVICFHHTRQLSQDRSTVVWELCELGFGSLQL